MKVLHVTYTYAPDPPGGTENYVAGLAAALRPLGWQSTIAAPGGQDAAYEHDGVPVMRFRGAGDALTLEQMYGAGDPVAAAAFERVLDAVRPGVVHFHAFTPAVSTLLLRQVRQRNIRSVFTYHTPTVSCQRGTLLEWGKADCDGMVRVHRCARCALHGLGMPAAAAWAAGSLPPAVGAALGASGISGRAATALRMTDLLRRRRAAFLELVEDADQLVAPSQWVRELLVRNGVSEGKIAICGQGIEPGGLRRAPSRTPGSRVRMAFFGRMDPAKGVHVLVEAMRIKPGLSLQLDVFGVRQSSSGDRYSQHVESLAQGDSRIRLLAALAPGEVRDALRDYDLLAVPSCVKETGPLVVLEAFDAGIPVIGSRLGGIAERVRDGVDGVLVAPGDVRAWAEALERLVADPAAISRLGSGVEPPRTIERVARDMAQLYDQMRGAKAAA